MCQDQKSYMLDVNNQSQIFHRMYCACLWVYSGINVHLIQSGYRFADKITDLHIFSAKQSYHHTSFLRTTTGMQPGSARRNANCNSSIHFRFPKTQLDRLATNQISVTGDAALNNRRIVNRPHACSREEPLLAQRSEVEYIQYVCQYIYLFIY